MSSYYVIRALQATPDGRIDFGSGGQLSVSTNHADATRVAREIYGRSRTACAVIECVRNGADECVLESFGIEGPDGDNRYRLA